MKFVVRRYFSGYCTYEIDAVDKNAAYEKARNIPIREHEILSTLKDWKDCDEVNPIANG
ncbi:MAG: hypothetical protein HYV59_04625 [Planctomycetes bacterium]|nr:hypothetical protein [Planctomycetota bacterium]